MATTRPDSAQAVRILGAAGLLTVFHDGMGQDRLRLLLERISPREHASPDKEALCAAVVRACLHSNANLDIAAQELGRVAARELGLVAETPAAQLRDRILGLPALHQARERARVMWALAVDGRPAALDVCRDLVGALEEAIQAAVGAHPVGAVRAAEAPAADPLHARLARMEEERAAALAQLGATKALLREETETRARAERDASLANARVRELETALAESQQDTARLRLELRMPTHSRALHARSEAFKERSQFLEVERDAANRHAADLQAQLDRLKEAQREFSGSMVARDQVAQERIRRLRESLKDVRRQRARSSQPDEAAQPGTERVAIHVDVANLAASAHRTGARKMDFVGLLPTLAQGRVVARAVAYTVEQGAPARFSAFCAALREAGFTVRVRKPVTRSDGSVKADWDMGLAMDVVEDPERVDTIILCSGDGDFLPLLQLMRRRGKRVEVASFRPDTQEELLRMAHTFHALDGSHTLAS